MDIEGTDEIDEEMQYKDAIVWQDSEEPEDNRLFIRNSRPQRNTKRQGSANGSGLDPALAPCRPRGGALCCPDVSYDMPIRNGTRAGGKDRHMRRTLCTGTHALRYQADVCRGGSDAQAKGAGVMKGGSRQASHSLLLFLFFLLCASALRSFLLTPPLSHGKVAQ